MLTAETWISSFYGEEKKFHIWTNDIASAMKHHDTNDNKERKSPMNSRKHFKFKNSYSNNIMLQVDIELAYNGRSCSPKHLFVTDPKERKRRRLQIGRSNSDATMTPYFQEKHSTMQSTVQFDNANLRDDAITTLNCRKNSGRMTHQIDEYIVRIFPVEPNA